ncbi:MAG: hypothetical protein M3253_03985 [Chloroflexota bacterium]|nr:hypothetical protein [Chloroflexota bacterium]
MSEPTFAGTHVHLPDQRTILGDWDTRQFITLQLIFDTDDGADHDAWAPLTSQEARDLAFALLECAEHADRRAQGA